MKKSKYVFTVMVILYKYQEPLERKAYKVKRYNLCEYGEKIRFNFRLEYVQTLVIEEASYWESFPQSRGSCDEVSRVILTYH